MLKTKPVPLIPARTARLRPSGTPAPQKLRRLTATALPKIAQAAPPRGRFQAGCTTFPCAVGAAGFSHSKREGDRASPFGCFRLLGGYFKPVAVRPNAPWPLRPIRGCDGWCDDPRSPAYNRPVRLPNGYSCEQMWRNDGLYDIVVILDHNLRPRRKGYGSAIFLHCARTDLAPTAGCIALRRDDLRKLLPRLARDSVLLLR